MDQLVINMFREWVLSHSPLANCVGCERRQRLESCSIYGERAKDQHSRLGGCAGRTHNRIIKDEIPFKVNPLKASKRSQVEGK